MEQFCKRLAPPYKNKKFGNFSRSEKEMNLYFCCSCKKHFEARVAKGCLYCLSKNIEWIEENSEVVIPESERE